MLGQSLAKQKIEKEADEEEERSYFFLHSLFADYRQSFPKHILHKEHRKEGVRGQVWDYEEKETLGKLLAHKDMLFFPFSSSSFPQGSQTALCL